jgi:xylulokinase
MPLVLGVDSSTSATKACLRQAEAGTVVARAWAQHPPTGIPPRSEADPRDWWAALASCLAQLGPLDDVAAVSVAAQQHGMVVADGAGEPLRPAKLWNDTESAPESARLVAALGPETWAREVGSVPVASFTVTKLAWLRNHEPACLDRMAKVVLPHDWLTWRLCGQAVTDRGDASGTGYWSPADGRWRPDLLELVDGSREWAACLPEVLGPTAPAGRVGQRAAQDFGLRPACLVGPGTGDNMAAALGMGLGVGELAVSLGTSATGFTVADQPVADPSGAVAGFADATGRFLPLVCTLNATGVTSFVAGLLGVDLGELDRLAASAPPGADGVVVVPHLEGERTPNRPQATARVTGLRAGTGRAELARAAFEGVVCNLLEALDALGGAGVRLSEGPIRLVGGGARSATFARVLADLSGRPVCLLDDEEPVATGACVQAAACHHRLPPEEVAGRWGLGRARSVVEPDPRVEAEVIRHRYRTAAGPA